MRLAGVIVAILFVSPAFSQLVEFPLSSHNSASKNTSKNTARTQAATLTLPFFDDFSYSDVLHYPDTSIWLRGNTVFLNNGIGINPPSKNVVTFDGLDSRGKTYSVNDVLAKGFADSLISKPIRLDQVAAGLRPTTYISFFYQIKGRGEMPDPGDNLILSFRNASKKWETIYTIEPSDALQSNIFYQVILPITDDRFFHEGFQIRFQNFARLSGAYDTWSIDYVYINVNRNANDTFFPDRTVSSQLNSLFRDYYSMPYKHFLLNPAANLKVPSVTLYNLQNLQQPFNFDANASITTWDNGVASNMNLVLDSKAVPSPPILQPQVFQNVSLKNIPPVSSFNTSADSVAIRLSYNSLTGDNIPIGATPTPGDYNPAIYSPIDFRTNDTISVQLRLSSYYAYDDNSAEYAIKLSQAGSYLAFKYLYKLNRPDTLIGVKIFFPEFGDNTTQSVQLQVRSDLSDTQPSILYQQVVQVRRATTTDSIRYYKFDPAVRISGDFYIGWKQLTNAVIPVGLDKNNDNGDKMFYNVNGTWIQNTTIQGSPVVRPVFGTGKPGVITGVENVSQNLIYPNPTNKICYLPGNAEMITVFDVTGRSVSIEIQRQNDVTSLTFISPVNGLVIVRYILEGRQMTGKIMVRPEY